MRVLFADDNPIALRTFERCFSCHQVAKTWTRKYVSSPGEALATLNRPSQIIDALVTDMRFIGTAMSGLELVRVVSIAKTFVRSLLYSAWDWTDEERAACLRAGATDVMHMPMLAIEEFIARVDRLQTLRPSTSPIFDLEGLALDGTSRTVMTGAGTIVLTPNSFALLAVLAAVRPRPATFNELLVSMGYEAIGKRHTVAEAVRQLRIQLQASDVVIRSVAGIGYRLVTASDAL